MRAARSTCPLLAFPVLLVLSLLLAPHPALAQWVADGKAVCTAAGAQQSIDIAADALGGAVMVWQDNRSGSHIYARQINNDGVPQWAADGIPICTAAGSQQSPHVAHDGFGYLFYTWQDSRNPSWDVYGAVTDRLGNVVSPAGGFPICTAGGDQTGVSLTSNPALGVGYAVWTDERNGHSDVFAQAFSQSNSGFWGANGLSFCTSTIPKSRPVIASDAPGDGAIVAWADSRTGNSDIYAQRADLGGTMHWAANGIAVTNHPSIQASPIIVSDGFGGAIIAWIDSRNGFNTSIYAQAINSSGVWQWTSNGLLVCSSGSAISVMKMVADGNGGAIITWEDERNSGTTGTDIYAQRVSSLGALWGPNGAVVCTAAWPQHNPTLSADGTGGAVITWNDQRTGIRTDIYAQHMDGSGVREWPANGVALCTETANQASPVIANDGTGASIVAWEDNRNGGASYLPDVFAQRIQDNSTLGHPQPTILTISDVPNDQGGHVLIQWKPGDGPVVQYEIYRYTDYALVAQGYGDGSSLYTTDVATSSDGTPNVYRVVVFTPCCSPQSLDVSGTSFDNLAPPAAKLKGNQLGPDIDLQWNSTAPDIASWSIERDEVGDFGSTGSLTYVDASPPVASHAYRVRAIDVHGNRGAWSNRLTIAMVTGVGDAPAVPRALTMLPNSPNPFTASTNLRLGMPRAGRVRVELFSAAGRRMATRDAGEFAAGWHDVTFDGRDDQGHLLPGGVYFYRVSAGRETQTGRMMIGR